MSDDTQVMVGDEAATLSQLAGIDFNAVEEVRQFTFPRGVFHWTVDPENPPCFDSIETEKGNKAIIRFTAVCINVVDVKQDPDNPIDPTDLVGKKHQETFFLSKAEDLGRVKALLIDLGIEGSGSFQDVMLKAVGIDFQAPIKHRADKNDKDRVYVNFDNGKGKIMPLAAAA